MKKFKNLFIYTAICAGFALYSCEGPMGPAGKDKNESCKLCHNPTVVDKIAVQFELSKHSYGEAAFEEAGNTTCAPCHASKGFKYVCSNNISTAFIADPANAGKFMNPYISSASTAYGEIGCTTCHDSLHTSYSLTDFSPLTTIAAVPMTMWGGAKTINLTQKGGEGNLCVKCHQPRPFTNSNTDKNVLVYSNLVANPTALFYSAADPGVDVLKPGYRTHTHYGTVGAIYAGMGGVEFGTGYTNSQHTTVASCQDCHMADMTGRAGGHTFKVRSGEGALTSTTNFNFNGCNVTGCHAASPISATTTSKYWKGTRDAVKVLLNQLATKLQIGGVDILNRNGDGESNLWAGLTTNNYDGYLNIYDPINNPSGGTYNTTMFKNPSTTNWTTAQITANNLLPVITLTNAQMGAIINFQLCLREYSLGIHNTTYTTTLLTNTIAALP